MGFLDSLNYSIVFLPLGLEDGIIKIDRLRELAEAKDYAGYGIEAHALKSVAASIGAMELSEMAKKHEFANYDGRYEFIDANYSDLLSFYQSLLDDIGLELRARGVLQSSEEVMGTDEEPKLPITEAELKQAVINIRNSIEDFDQDSALQKLEWLLNFEVGADTGIKENQKLPQRLPV